MEMIYAMRKRLFEIIEKSDGNDRLSTLYDYTMIVVITLSLIPLLFKQENRFFEITDKVTAGIFIVDYLLRWATADYKFEKAEITSFLRYPFSGMAIVDLLSILPSLTIVNSSLKVLRVVRMMRAMRVVRVFKAMRYSRSFEIINNVIRTSKDSLIAVCALAAGYILISAIIIYLCSFVAFLKYAMNRMLADKDEGKGDAPGGSATPAGAEEKGGAKA